MRNRVLVSLALSTCCLSGTGLAQDLWATPESVQEPSQAAAQAPAPAPAPAPVAASGAAPSLDSAPQTYAGRVMVGLRQIVLRDFDSAIASLREAAQLEPALPAAFCHLGDAQLEKGDLAEARLAYDSCARFAAAAKDSRYSGLALIGIARATELGKARFVEKRDAWKRVAEGVEDPAAKALATARVQVFDEAITRDVEYEAVRKRIAERAAQQKP